MVFAKGRGNECNKMDESNLTKIVTPSKNITFAESDFVIECNIMQITTMLLDDLYTSELKEQLADEYTEESHYRKLVIGEITNAWQKK